MDTQECGLVGLTIGMWPRKVMKPVFDPRKTNICVSKYRMCHWAWLLYVFELWLMWRKGYMFICFSGKIQLLKERLLVRGCLHVALEQDELCNDFLVIIVNHLFFFWYYLHCYCTFLDVWSVNFSWIYVHLFSDKCSFKYVLCSFVV